MSANGKKSALGNEKTARDLYRAILTLKSVEECQRFFTDLCTPSELTALADRWRVARLVERDVPYREIYERTGVSTATITRVARCVQYGEGGYRRVLAAIAKIRPGSPKANKAESSVWPTERTKD